MPEYFAAIPIDDAHQAFAELARALGSRERARAFVEEVRVVARLEGRRR